MFCAVFMLLTFRASASVLYVNLNSANATPPYVDWSTAATNIQDAIDASTDGDQILVTNGIYQAGGRVMAGDLTNRVALNKAISVQSISGPRVTTIRGAGATNGATAVRCAWLTNGASLIGFTLTGGATRKAGDTTSLQSGGGVWCASTNSFHPQLFDRIEHRFSEWRWEFTKGTINSSLVSSNGTILGIGGATYQSVLNNCTIVSNSTYGAASPFAMTNCIIYYNGSLGNFNHREWIHIFALLHHAGIDVEREILRPRRSCLRMVCIFPITRPALAGGSIWWRERIFSGMSGPTRLPLAVRNGSQRRLLPRHKSN